MAKVEIFTTKICPYCDRAKALLKSKGVSYTEVDLTHDPEGRVALVERSGGYRTVPQIFINDKHYGGCDDLYALDKAGKLDEVLNG